MPSALNLYQAVYTKLTADQTAGSFYDDVGGRIRFVQGSQDQQTPLCIIRHTSFIPDRAFTAPDDQTLTFGIDLFVDVETTATAAFLPETLIATWDKLLTLLDRVTITATNYNRAQVLLVSLDAISREGDGWAISSTWKITGTPTS